MLAGRRQADGVVGLWRGGPGFLAWAGEFGCLAACQAPYATALSGWLGWVAGWLGRLRWLVRGDVTPVRTSVAACSAPSRPLRAAARWPRKAAGPALTAPARAASGVCGRGGETALQPNVETLIGGLADLRGSARAGIEWCVCVSVCCVAGAQLGGTPVPAVAVPWGGRRCLGRGLRLRSQAGDGSQWASCRVDIAGAGSIRRGGGR